MAGEDLAYFANNEKISAYNEAQFKIKRLHDSWVLCNNYRRAGKNEALQWELDTIWDELSDDATKKDQKAEELIKKIDDDIFAAKKTWTNSKLGIEQRKAGESLYYFHLRNKYRQLKSYQNMIGMGGKYKNAADDEPMDE